MRLPEAYAARSVRLLELWSWSGWRLKIYGIAYRNDSPQPELVDAGKELARGCLPQPASADGRYGVGFVGVHEGRDANLVFVDWWADENELHHHVFTATTERPTEFTDVTGSGLAACVWDLAVIGFERRAWIDSVLVRPDADGIERYLDCRFEAAI